MSEYDATDDAVKSYYAAIEAKRLFVERPAEPKQEALFG